jgi:prephenate dehydrogenase
VEFVAGRPVSKEYMKSVEDAAADAFDEGVYCIVTSRTTSQPAVKTIVGLAELLGAKPLFLDEHEHDSYTSAALNLPVLLSAALVNSVSSGPAWREIARVGGGEFGLVSELSSGDAEDNALACLSSPETTMRWLDQAIEELTAYRGHIESGGEELGRSFDKALDDWAKWKTDTVVPNEAPDLPSAGETMSGLFFGRHISRRFRDLTKDAGSDEPKR